MVENASVRAHRVEVRKSFLMPVKSVKPAPKVTRFAILTVPFIFC